MLLQRSTLPTLIFTSPEVKSASVMAIWFRCEITYVYGYNNHDYQHYKFLFPVVWGEQCKCNNH